MPTSTRSLTTVLWRRLAGIRRLSTARGSDDRSFGQRPQADTTGAVRLVEVMATWWAPMRAANSSSAPDSGG